MVKARAPEIPIPQARPEVAVPTGDTTQAADLWASQLSSLLSELDTVAVPTAPSPAVISEGLDNQLIQVRLGAASSLFAALRCRHAPTAAHALRVALSCSAWALRMGLQQRHRDVVEMAALLHDVGLVGVPDQVLLKPGGLDSNETAIVARARRMSLEILRQSCAAPEVLEVVEHVPAWYDGSRRGFRLRQEQIPLGARMIAVAEAFDAMVTDRVYRAAMSQERASAELFRCAATQFDPALVRHFVEFQSGDQSRLYEEVAGRWLRSLEGAQVNSYWRRNDVAPPNGKPTIDALFQGKLLENMYDAVVFLDAAGQVVLWNRGAERLTGIDGSGILQTQWHPGLLSICDERGFPIGDADCPVASAIRSGVQSLRRLTISGRNGRSVAVDTHAIPVTSEDGAILGAILLFHDASSETSLERRCQSLHEKATKDPLTQVANRAEFDRVHEMFVTAHQQQQVPCSLIICDLDHFKQVNDTYGHPVGDEVIKGLANLLKSSCRPGDLVARYGGEEFVLLCAGCDNAASVRRAEQIRLALSQLPQRQMGGRAATASFGVTEIQPGDTPETMLRRADRALLLAKQKGRNTVVQLGSGSAAEPEEPPARFWSRPKQQSPQTIERVLVTPVPVQMAIEKLRGFVADHRAKIIQIDGNQVQLEIDDQASSRLRRLTDRPVTFRVDLSLEREQYQKEGAEATSGGMVRTRIRINITPKSSRDRRRADALDRAREVLASFRSYLMASEEETTPPSGALTRVKLILAPWLAKR